MLPTVASLLLAALWALSVFGGWGPEAFCAGAEAPQACTRRLGAVSVVSALFAGAAATCTVMAWVLPRARRDGRAFGRLIGAALAAWVVAGAVLFVGGLLAG
jgi:hypothetical protein